MIFDFKQIINTYNLPLKGVIHVGGHHGHEISVYKESNSQCHVEIFEPHPKSFEILMNTVQQYQGVNAHNIALGSQESTMTMFVETANGGQSNSLLRPKKHMEQYPHIKFESTIQVPVKTLDSFSLDDRYNFLSIDVQGFELEVLKGAKETLKNIDFIICEVNNTELYLGCCMVEDIDDFLAQYGFRREATNWLGGTWGDGFYIKK